MHPKEWTTVPVMPCVSLDETISFWQLLGYQVTYYQHKPYGYGVVMRGGHELHFYRVKGRRAAETNYGCLVMVGSAEAVHLEFSKSLRSHTGKVPNAGLPRISRMKPGQTRFTVTDPSGNAVIFISLGEKDQDIYNEVNKPGLTPLQKSIAIAVRFRDFKNDDQAAAKTLDAGLKREGGEQNTDIAEALLMRMELAIELNEQIREKECCAGLKNIQLTQEEIKQLKEKLHLPDEIAHLLAG